MLLQEWTYAAEDRPKLVIGDLGELFYDKEEATEEVTTWVYEEGSFVPIAKVIDGEKFSIVSDYIGRPIQAFNSDGEKVWETEYDIYGRLLNLRGDKSFIPFRQLGQYEDVELGGLYYNRFRYYDSSTGTYINKDPIGLAGKNPNLYAYVQDSNTWIDAFGLDCSKIKVGDEIAPNSTVKRIRPGTNGQTIVIGRNMDTRVVPAAKNIGADHWKGFDNTLPQDVNLANNKKWLDEKIAEGNTVIDIGLDPKYVNMGGVGSKTKEPFYSMETQVAFGKKW